MIKIRTKSLKTLSEREYDLLWRLTEPDGAMRNWLNWVDNDHAYYLYAAIAYDRKMPVGWAALFGNRQEPDVLLGVFVDEDYRGQGIGRKLVNALLKRFRKNVSDREIHFAPGIEYLFVPILDRHGLRYAENSHYFNPRRIRYA